MLFGEVPAPFLAWERRGWGDLSASDTFPSGPSVEVPLFKARQGEEQDASMSNGRFGRG